MTISIVTVVYNDRLGFLKTLDSIKLQKKHMSDFQYIVIDGGSTDGTVECINQNLDIINVIISEPDFGIYDAMNKALDYATNDFVLFMNAGDVFFSGSVVKYLTHKIHEYPNVDLFYSDTYLSNGVLYECDIKRLKIIHQSLCYRKRLHDKYGKYVVAKNISISDYLFFSLVKDCIWLKVDVISIFELGGISSKSSHFYQKLLVDYYYNNTSLIKIMLYCSAKFVKDCFRQFWINK